MKYRGYPCRENYEISPMLIAALHDVLTERYAVLEKPVKRNWIFFTTERIDKKLIRIPKRYQDDYEEKTIQCMKDILSLIDRGYSRPITEEAEEIWRKTIAEYQMNKNEVWE